MRTTISHLFTAIPLCALILAAPLFAMAQAASDTTPPSVPTGLSASAASQTQINLTWTASTDNVGVTGYNVFRNGLPQGTSATNSYSDTGLTASTLYSYNVAAYDAAGNNSAQSTGASATTQSGGTGGTTYYVSPSGNDFNNGTSPATAWATIAKVNSALFLPGDIIDGQGGTFYERLVIPSSGNGTGSITFQNFTLDGTMSFDGSHSINPSNTETNISPWSLESGEVYKKTCTRPIFQFFEDDVKLVAMVSTSAAQATANLARGQFTWFNNVLYYRASNGGAPGTHSLRGTRRDLDGLPGLLSIVSKNYITINNVTVRRYSPNSATAYNHGVYVANTDHVVLNGATNITGNNQGLEIRASNNFSMAPTASVSDNIIAGVLLEGTGTNIDISGTFNRNGRYLNYLVDALVYAGDGDNIGIGGDDGGTISDVSIHDATITNGGAPDGHTNTFGAGIYLGTIYNMTVPNLSIVRNTVSGNHNHGIYLGPQFAGGKVQDNVITNNVNNTGSANAVHINVSNAPSITTYITNNTIYGNPANAGLYATGTGQIKNHQLSWWFDGEPLKAVLKDTATFGMGLWDH